MAAQLQAALTIIRRKKVEQRTGLSRSTLYGKIKFNPKRPKEYDPTFPLPITLGNGARAIGWLEAEIDAWLAAQVERSRTTDTRQRERENGRLGAEVKKAKNSSKTTATGTTTTAPTTTTTARG